MPTRNTSTRGTSARPKRDTSRRTGGAALAREMGVHPTAISHRLAQGETIEEIRAAWEAKKQAPMQGYTPSRKSSFERVTAVLPIKAPSIKVGAAGVEAGDDDYEDGGGDGDGNGEGYLNLNQQRARNQQALAELNEIKVARERGELIVAEKASRDIANKAAKVKDGLMRLREMSDRLAVESDPAKIDKMILAEITKILEDFAADVEAVE